MGFRVQPSSSGPAVDNMSIQSLESFSRALGSSFRPGAASAGTKPKVSTRTIVIPRSECVANML
jgi:hypothetical protein